MMFLRTITRSIDDPAFESAVMARTVVRHVVSESGNCMVTRACPCASVCTEGAQYAVSGNALRTLGWATSLPGFTCASCGRYRDSRCASIGDLVPAWPLK